MSQLLISRLKAELERLVQLCDTEAVMPDGSSPDTLGAHAVLGDLKPAILVVAVSVPTSTIIPHWVPWPLRENVTKDEMHLSWKCNRAQDLDNVTYWLGEMLGVPYSVD